MITWQKMMVDAYGRIPEKLEAALKGLSKADLEWRPGPLANSIGWLAWHLARGQDKQIAALMGKEQLWVKDGWYKKFERSADPADTGYGHSAAQVKAFRSPGSKTQMDYLRAVNARTKRYILSLKPAELNRKLNEPQWKPLPTVGVRIVSILGDGQQHLGQAAYIRGLRKVKK